MKKIQISTIEKMANIQVIELNASFIARCIRLQVKLESIMQDAKRTKRRYNDEEKKYEDVLDENGEKIIEYSSIDGNFIAENVLPFVYELCEAFDE